LCRSDGEEPVAEVISTVPVWEPPPSNERWTAVNHIEDVEVH